MLTVEDRFMGRLSQIACLEAKLDGLIYMGSFSDSLRTIKPVRLMVLPIHQLIVLTNIRGNPIDLPLTTLELKMLFFVSFVNMFLFCFFFAFAAPALFLSTKVVVYFFRGSSFSTILKAGTL